MKKIKDRKLNKQSETTREIKVQGDGNCFYRCLGYHFYGDENKHADIRREVVGFIKDNSEKFQVLLMNR